MAVLRRAGDGPQRGGADDILKSRAGRRLVAIPRELLPQLREHVERYSDKAADGWVFLRPKSARLRRSGFRRT
jgi:hypothetical protein